MCRILIQCNLIDRESRTATQHMDQIFKEIEDHLKNNSNATDVIIAGGFNQSVRSKAIQNFFSNIRAIEAHYKHINIEMN